MRLNQERAEVYIPDQVPLEMALGRTTHLCFAAHQDDVEIMAAQPILECFQRQDRWFTAVVVTDGSASPRAGAYEQFTNEAMRLLRSKEQRKAAFVGEYSALVLLDYPSRELKQAAAPEPVEDILQLLKLTRPEVVYTHNLTDRHDTHVAVTLRVIEALRRLARRDHPARLLGCEVWRSLDWLVDADRVIMDVSDREHLQLALLGVFDSQIAGGKRYDLASMGRRRANATFLEAHGVDAMAGSSYAVDMTPLLHESHLDPAVFARGLIQNFQGDVAARIARLA